MSVLKMPTAPQFIAMTKLQSARSGSCGSGQTPGGRRGLIASVSCLVSREQSVIRTCLVCIVGPAGRSGTHTVGWIYRLFGSIHGCYCG